MHKLELVFPVGHGAVYEHLHTTWCIVGAP